MNRKVILLGMWMMVVADVCAANNGTWDKVREKKARIVKKLKKDFRKLKKQEGAVKLVGGNGAHEGNVEILHDGKWGSVCDDEWDYLEANVVCRQLGFDGAIKPTANGHFGQARSEMILPLRSARYFLPAVEKPTTEEDRLRSSRDN